MGSLERDELFKIYELIVNEEQFYNSAHRSSISTYTTIITALIAGTIFGLFQVSESSDSIHLAFAIFGSILILSLSETAIRATRRIWNHFLETITVRAKIEQELGLTDLSSSEDRNDDLYWRGEAIIPNRYINSRKLYDSSDTFVKENIRRGFQLWTEYLFRIFQLISILMLILLLYLSVNC